MPAMGQPVADLRDYGAVLFARRWLIAGITLVAALGTLAWIIQLTPYYVAESRVLVLPLQDPLVSLVPINNGLSQPNLNTETQIIQSTAVARRIRESQGISTPIDTLLDGVDVSSVTDADVLIIKYSARDPQTAAKLANAFAAAYIEQRTEQAQAIVNKVKTSVQDQVTPIRKRISGLTEIIAASTDPAEQKVLQARVDVLLGKLQTLEQYLVNLDASSFGAQGGQIVQEAAAPAAAANIHVVRDLVLGLLGGLFLGVLAAFVAQGFDPRLRSGNDIPSLMGPIIGAIPRTKWGRSDGARVILTSDPRSPASEAYRTLATNVRHVASENGAKVITVTSALEGEGKTTTAVNLAVVLAQGGATVVLVSGDLRHPSVHELVELDNDAGLTDVLSDSVGPRDVAKESVIPNLRVVCSGPIPDDPVGLLSGPKLSTFLRDLRGMANFVVIDTPPVLPVADALILVSASDATVFVLDARRSVRDAVEQSAERIEASGGMPIGVVVNNFDPRRSRIGGVSGAYYYFGTPRPSTTSTRRGSTARRGSSEEGS
jgi:polysaccharide biosynthesis transport protein